MPQTQHLPPEYQALVMMRRAFYGTQTTFRVNRDEAALGVMLRIQKHYCDEVARLKDVRPSSKIIALPITKHLNTDQRLNLVNE